MSPTVTPRLSRESSTLAHARWLHALSLEPRPVESVPHLTRKSLHQCIILQDTGKRRNYSMEKYTFYSRGMARSHKPTNCPNWWPPDLNKCQLTFWLPGSRYIRLTLQYAYNLILWRASRMHCNMRSPCTYEKKNELQFYALIYRDFSLAIFCAPTNWSSGRDNHK